MTKTIAYLRVSTDKQADHGVSLEAQRQKVKPTRNCTIWSWLTL